VCVRGKAASPGDLTPGVGGSCYHDDLFDTRPSIELSELCSPGFDFGRHFGRTRAYTLRIASPISGVDITR
jgi:hypothetical protein